MVVRFGVSYVIACMDEFQCASTQGIGLQFGRDASDLSAYPDAWGFFATHTGRVEIIRDRRLQRFYFPKPPGVCARTAAAAAAACVRELFGWQ